MNAECMTLNCEKGTSAYAGPHYQKLYSRVTHARGDRRVQPTEVQWMASPWRNLLLDQFFFFFFFFLFMDVEKKIELKSPKLHTQGPPGTARAALGSMPVPPTTAKNRGILILRPTSHPTLELRRGPRWSSP